MLNWTCKMQTQMTVSLIPRYVGVYRRYSIWSIYKVASDCNRDSFQSKRIYKAYSFVFCCLGIEMIHYGGHVFNLLSFPCILTAPFNYILLLSFVIIIWCKDLGKEARFKSITTLHRNIHFNNIQCCVFFFFRYRVFRFAEFAKRAHMANASV